MTRSSTRYLTMRYGLYFTHAHSHIAKAVAAMDSSFALIRVIKFRVCQGIVGDHKIILNTQNFPRNPLINPCQLKTCSIPSTKDN